MFLIVELSAKDDAAAEKVGRRTEEYFETLLGSELLKFRIARNQEHASRLVTLEEWTDAAAHEASFASTAFADFQRNLAPLLVNKPRATRTKWSR